MPVRTYQFKIFKLTGPALEKAEVIYKGANTKELVPAIVGLFQGMFSTQIFRDEHGELAAIKKMASLHVPVIQGRTDCYLLVHENYDASFPIPPYATELIDQDRDMIAQHLHDQGFYPPVIFNFPNFPVLDMPIKIPIPDEFSEEKHVISDHYLFSDVDFIFEILKMRTFQS